MTDNELREAKERAITVLKEQTEMQREQLLEVDARLLMYYEGLADGEVHNIYEILCAIRLLRIMRTHIFDVTKVHHAMWLYEGEWEKDATGVWKHKSGGFLFSGLFGRTHYMLTPIQVFMLAGVFGPHYLFDTGFKAGARAMLPTECVVDGKIFDYRMLMVEAFFFIPRKFGKTTMGAFFQTYFFFFADYNCEGVCCANAQSQSKILFDAAYDLIHQLDPQEKRIRFTATCVNWRKGQIRQSKMEALSAGGKTKDGMFAQICSADEFGAAAYVNGRSDMAQLVNVIESSMGPRRERLTIHTTTAGLSLNGPCEQKLKKIEKELLRELEEEPSFALAEDRYFWLLLQPDTWEKDMATVFSDQRIWHKVNPHIGITVQPDYYDTEIHSAMAGGIDKQKETLSKLFNVFQTEQVKDWVVTSDKIRKLQQPRRVTDCLWADGWHTFVGADFSSGEDLYAISTLSVNVQQGSPDFGQFFADCFAWIIGTELQRSPNHRLYEKWVEQGWLRVCPGEVFHPDMAIDELMSLSEKGVNLMMFGYDPAQSKQPVNTIKAWLQSLGLDADTIKAMVVPVSQNFMTFNGLIGEVEYMTLGNEPWLHFSESPLWPWEFGNVMIEESRDGLRKVLKSSAEKKVDNIHALIDALYCFDLSEGKVEG